jgi:hypothetical protein
MLDAITSTARPVHTQVSIDAHSTAVGRAPGSDTGEAPQGCASPGAAAGSGEAPKPGYARGVGAGGGTTGVA